MKLKLPWTVSCADILVDKSAGLCKTLAQLALIQNEDITPFLSYASTSIRKHPKLDHLLSVSFVVVFN